MVFGDVGRSITKSKCVINSFFVGDAKVVW